MLRILFLVGFLSVGFASTLSAAQGPPNIVLIMADDLGYGELGCYGQKIIRTPNIDRLAATGAKFDHCYSMPVCHPTRLALMSGKYPIHLGDTKWGDFPDPEERFTFANVLQQAGYATGIAGKWQLCLLRDDPSHPRRLGFLHSELFGWHEGPRYYEPMIYRNGKVRTDTLGHYGPDLYVRSLIEFMKANRDQPFLAYYSMAVAHDVTDDLEKPVPHGPFGRYDSYSEMVSEMDRAVGRLIAALNALKLRERTLVIFVGDNGTPKSMIARAEGQDLIKVPVASRRFGRIVPGGKGNLTNDGTSVPLIVNWPGSIEPRVDSETVVDFTDFLPTFAELAGVDTPKDRSIDGHSFVASLFGDGQSKKQFAFCQEAVLPKPGGTEPEGESSGLSWVRNASWKLYSDGRLFDMANDPQESRPIRASADSQEEARIRDQLKAGLNSVLK